MNRNEISDRVAAEIVSLCGERQITEISNLKTELGLDSLSLVTLIVRLEDTFHIVFDEGDLDPGMLISVGNLIDLVEKTL